MVCDTLSDGYANARANKGEAHARISNHHGHTCEHVLTRGHIHARVPCVSVDWVNQPNFPFFFSVRSASVTPWRYQHAVHTARQQRQQWTSTEQREGGREKEREIERKRRKVRQEKAAGHTTVQTQLLHPGKRPNRKKISLC